MISRSLLTESSCRSTDRATRAPFTVLDGATALSTVPVNQRLRPDDRSDAGAAWEDLGIFTIRGPSLVVRVSDAADGIVIADAIRVERVADAPPPPQYRIDVRFVDNGLTASQRQVF